MIPPSNESCPLCQSEAVEHFHRDKKRNFRRCIHCLLVFVSSPERLTLEEERQQYDLHQNVVDDPEYRRFLSKIFIPITAIIAAPAAVLDFGCGPGPALAQMFQEKGYESEVYDPYFYADTKVLEQRYQIITLTEVIEHLFHPLDELLRLRNLLLPGGVIGIMTKRLADKESFANWHYKNDPTHVCFYSDKTFHWLARHLGMTLEFCGNDSLILSDSQ